LSFAATADKFSLKYFSPISYSFLLYLLIAIGFVLIVKKMNVKARNQWTFNKRFFILIGLLISFATLTQFFAFSLTNVSYVASVRMMSVIIAVIGGRIFFKEKHFANRFVGSLIMIAGAALLFI